MEHRQNWKEYANNVSSTIFNFKWQQNTIGLDFNNLNVMESIVQVLIFL